MSDQQQNPTQVCVPDLFNHVSHRCVSVVTLHVYPHDGVWWLFTDKQAGAASLVVI